MRFLFKCFVVLLVLGAIGAAAWKPASEFLRKRNQPEFRTEDVKRGEITSVVNATGEVQPVLKVAVGTFVSGPITELHVEFNDRVRKNQILARIDPRIYEAAVARDQAALLTRQAEVERTRLSDSRPLTTKYAPRIFVRKVRTTSLSRKSMDFTSPACHSTQA